MSPSAGPSFRSELLGPTEFLRAAAGSRGAFAVYLYRYDDAQRPRHMHLFSKGHTMQSDYELHYDDAGNLIRVTDVLGHPVWPKR